tara:strand:- start:9236 stop:10354 length:1119 start_codon:yes stop_codon:yes gene_type:complete
MRSKLFSILGNSYKVIPNYISKKEAIRLGKKFEKETREKNLPGEAGNLVGENHNDEYMNPDHVALLSEKTKFLNKLFGTKVVPSYCYSRVYRSGTHLGRHKDRPACEVSLSVHLYGTKEWAFGIVDKDGKDIEVVLQPGDAIIYDAPYAEHWRPPFPGNDDDVYVQTFQHYVFLNGKFENEIFDKKNSVTSVGISNDLKSQIFLSKGVFTKKECKEIIKRAIKVDDWEPQQTVGKHEGVRVCEGWFIPKIEEIDSLIHSKVGEILRKSEIYYTELGGSPQINEDHGYTVLKYIPGGKYDQHIDQGPTNNRVLTMIIALNDDYEGGEVEFWDGKYKLRLNKGDVLVFPSNFMFPHAIVPIKSGERYSIVTWIT